MILNFRLPIVWATSIVTRARKEGRIRDDFAVKTIIDELNKFRGQAGLLLSYDTISVPLVYTQVCCTNLEHRTQRLVSLRTQGIYSPLPSICRALFRPWRLSGVSQKSLAFIIWGTFCRLGVKLVTVIFLNARFTSWIPSLNSR